MNTLTTEVRHSFSPDDYLVMDSQWLQIHTNPADLKIIASVPRFIEHIYAEEWVENVREIQPTLLATQASNRLVHLAYEQNFSDLPDQAQSLYKSILDHLAALREADYGDENQQWLTFYKAMCYFAWNGKQTPNRTEPTPSGSKLAETVYYRVLEYRPPEEKNLFTTLEACREELTKEIANYCQSKSIPLEELADLVEELTKARSYRITGETATQPPRHVQRMCTECKHMQHHHEHVDTKMCVHPNAPRDPVNGELYQCSIVRHDANLCAWQGNWFQQRPSFIPAPYTTENPAPPCTECAHFKKDKDGAGMCHNDKLRDKDGELNRASYARTLSWLCSERGAHFKPKETDQQPA